MPTLEKHIRKFEKSLKPDRRQEFRDAKRTWLKPYMDQIAESIDGGKSPSAAIADVLKALE
jgi:hypothetical protein